MKCHNCDDLHMIPSYDPDGDVMNTPCPICNIKEPEQTYSADSMSHCYEAFIEFFPWSKEVYPTYEEWICSDAEVARTFRQGWAAFLKVQEWKKQE